MSSSDSDCSSTATPVCKRAKYAQKYNVNWESDPIFSKWIGKSSKGAKFAFCKLCFMDISVVSLGKTGLVRHSKTSIHLKIVNGDTAQPRSVLDMPRFSLKSSIENKCREGEIKFTAFIVEHNIPMNVMEHLPKLCESIFSDSETAKKIAFSRTKSTSIIKNVIDFKMYNNQAVSTGVKPKNTSNQPVGYCGTRPKEQLSRYPKESSNSDNEDHLDDTPLEKKQISILVNGVMLRKKAIHPDWIEPIIFVQCSHPQFLMDRTLLSSGGVDTWLEEISFLCADLEQLLGLPYYKFWSQIIYDNSVHLCLDSFLSTRLRWFDNLAYNADMVSAAERTDQLVFLIYLRMATYKESKVDHISPAAFGKLVYDNYIFDCCKFLDLCVLYGSSNSKILNKMMNNLFANEPKFNDDLRVLVSSLKNVLSNIEKELEIFPDKIPISLKKLTNVISFMADNLFSVFSFLKVYPEAASIFQEEYYLERLCLFYEAAIPFISENLSYYSQDGVDIEEFKHKFDMARIGALSLFRHLLHDICIRPLKTKKLSSDQLERCITYFIHIITTAAEEKIFITDYDSMFGFVDDFKLFEVAGADITPLDYIKDSVARSVAETITDYGWQAHALGAKTASQTVPPLIVDDTSGMNGYFHANQEDSSIEIFSLIIHVQDLLPDLGAGFIRECLKYYSFSVEDTLNAIFECNLPPSLDILDRKMPDEILREKKVATKAEPPPLGGVKSILEDRVNVYNGDEFDTFSSKDTLKKVRTGKKPTILMPPDEDLMNKLKGIAREYDKTAGYSIYEDEFKYTPMHSADYDDEYDDTYEGGYFKANMRNLAERGPSIFGKGALNVKGIDFDATSSDTGGEDDTTPGTDQRVGHAAKRLTKKAKQEGPFNGKNSSKPDSTRKGDGSDNARRNDRNGPDGNFRKGNSHQKGGNRKDDCFNTRKGGNRNDNGFNIRKGDDGFNTRIGDNRNDDGFNTRKGSNRNDDGFNTRKGDNRNKDGFPDNSRKRKAQNPAPEVSESATPEVSAGNEEPESATDQNRGWQPLDFCQNPEDVRQRAEERRRTKMALYKRRQPIGEQQYRMPEHQSAARQANQHKNTNGLDSGANKGGRPLRQEGDKPAPQRASGNKEDVNKAEAAENKVTESGDSKTPNTNKDKQKQEDVVGNQAGKKKDAGEKNAYRKKNIHKNEHKRFGAQAKARGRF